MGKMKQNKGEAPADGSPKGFSDKAARRIKEKKNRQAYSRDGPRIHLRLSTRLQKEQTHKKKREKEINVFLEANIYESPLSDETVIHIKSE